MIIAFVGTHPPTLKIYHLVRIEPSWGYIRYTLSLPTQQGIIVNAHHL